MKFFPDSLYRAVVIVASGHCVLQFYYKFFLLLKYRWFYDHFPILGISIGEPFTVTPNETQNETKFKELTMQNIGVSPNDAQFKAYQISSTINFDNREQNDGVLKHEDTKQEANQGILKLLI